MALLVQQNNSPNFADDTEKAFDNNGLPIRSGLMRVRDVSDE